MPLPPTGLTREAVRAALAAYRQRDVPWREGRIYAGVYDPGPDVAAVVTEAYTGYLSENALYPNYFPSLLQLENDVVRTVADLLQGDEHVAGNCTSGGTESILLAVKTARDAARARHPEITAPEMIVAQTAHPAFHKAGHYLGVKVIVTPFDTATLRADPAAMRAAITPNTILLVASAPCYSYGVIDPVEDIAALAAEHGLLCHVDACVGGIQLSIMRRSGGALPPFDFSVPGVSTISVDMHKYGYAAKNVSTLLYRSRDLRRFALYANAQTTGYVVLNPTVLSSKSGGPIAGAWAALNYLGEEGYRKIVGEVMATTRRMMAGIQALPDLRILGQPDMSMFAVASDTLNVFALDDAIARRGWSLQPQFRAGGVPATLHIAVNRSNVGHEDAFLAALADACAEVKAQPDAVGDVAELRAEVTRLMSQPVGRETFAQIAALADLRPGEMPDGFARVNTVLDALPRPMVEALLVEYLNGLYD
ncbi:MAG TPA: aspartate aminotransferase family protein [Ktedonobacterales bacterium]|nr:aspartate aminotransferase family protein [Ktedonobacterales bacterium]